MPGNLRKKPSKPNEDFAVRRWWRTSSALLLPLPLPLFTGPLGCIMSCILIHNEWRIGEVPMEFFCPFSTFQFSIFFVIHFVSAVRIFELQSSICRDWRESRLSWFSWLHRTLVLRPSAESPNKSLVRRYQYRYRNFFSEMNLYKTENLALKN